MFQNRIKEILHEQGRTQVWLAELLKINCGTMYHWTAHRRPVPQEQKQPIKLFLGVPEYLVFPDGE